MDQIFDDGFEFGDKKRNTHGSVTMFAETIFVVFLLFIDAIVMEQPVKKFEEFAR